MDDVEGIEEDDVPWVEGVFDCAFGALGDEHCGGGDGVVLSSWVRSIKRCLGGMMAIFCLLDDLEMEVLGDDMMLVMECEG